MNLHSFNFEIFKNPQKSQQKFTKKFTKTIDKKKEQKFQEMGRRPVRARCHWSNISNEFVHVPLRFFFFNEGKKKGQQRPLWCWNATWFPHFEGKIILFLCYWPGPFWWRNGSRIRGSNVHDRRTHTHTKKGAHSTLLSVDS